MEFITTINNGEKAINVYQGKNGTMYFEEVKK